MASPQSNAFWWQRSKFRDNQSAVHPKRSWKTLGGYRDHKKKENQERIRKGAEKNENKKKWGEKPSLITTDMIKCKSKQWLGMDLLMTWEWNSLGAFHFCFGHDWTLLIYE